MTGGRLQGPQPWLVDAADGEDAGHVGAGILSTDGAGRCVFRKDARCTVHGALDHAALPIACQHFPRVCLVDDRGVFVTLSHFCPTAAALLFEPGPVTIVEGPPPLAGGAIPEGLDARGAWPPLLSPGMLMDLEAYTAWEAHVVRRLAGPGAGEGRPDAVLDALREDVAVLHEWAPGRGCLADAVRALGAGRRAEAGRGPRASTLTCFRRVTRLVPAPLAWPDAPGDFANSWASRVAPGWPEWAPVVRRYLAAHAFGSWLAYQGRGLDTIVRGLDAVLAVLEVELVRVCTARDQDVDRDALIEAIGQADLLLRHYIDPQALARALTSFANAGFAGRRPSAGGRLRRMDGF